MDEERFQNEEPEASQRPWSSQAMRAGIGIEEASAVAVAERGAVAQPPTADMTTLLTQFRETTRRYQRRVRRAIQLGIGASLVTGLFDIAALSLAWQTGQFPVAAIVSVWALDALVLGYAVMSPVQAARQRQELARRLGGYTNAHVAGPLAEMLGSADRALRQAAEAALLAVLPHLTAEDAVSVSDDQRDCLYAVLRDAERHHAALKIAILHALPSIGDSRALPWVERLADMPARDAIRRQVRQAANDCLPQLRQSTAHEASRQTLLRAQCEPSSEAGVLLRSVCEHMTSPTQLLRPAEQEDFLITTVSLRENAPAELRSTSV